MCLYPKIIKNKKYTSNKKNGGVIPSVPDERVLYVPVGCGRCMECKKKKQREWQVRLLEDVRHNRNGKFVTLTFSDQAIAELASEIEGLGGYNLDNAIATLGVRRFLERWRKENKKSVRHWLVTELGHNGTKNIHIHGIIWTDNTEQIKKHWGKYGTIWAGYGDKETYVNEKTVNYITKYISKQDLENKEYEPKILTSAGIGKGYTDRDDSRLNRYTGEETKEYYKTRTGHKIALPIYWRNKIYKEEERENLWLHKLDKQERWINGERVSIKENEEEYYKLLEHHRAVNKRLGYGDDEINWERKRYEQERRNINIRKRIIKGENKKKKK